MTFHIKEILTSEIGKKMQKELSFGGILGIYSEGNFNLDRDFILSKYGSFDNFKDKATSGQDWEAESLLSSAYQEGIPELNIEKDLDKAIDLLESSSMEKSKHTATVIFELATLHDRKGTVPHQHRAHELYLEAAKLGFIQAELHLAEMYRCGVRGVVDKDLEEAFKWYRRAAGEELQVFDAKTTSCSSYRVQGILRNMNIDFKFIALKCLHEYYMSGDCPERKPQPIKALYYLKKAAELGDLEAQKDLGLSYLTGESGQPKDLDKAKRWLGKSANSGDQEAKEVLKKLDVENIVEAQPETIQPDISGFLKQFGDILKIEQDQNKHPYLVQNPMLFNESMFTQYPDSPTAQHYLKAFQLVKEGIEIIQKTEFNDPEGIKLLAHGYLYENTIIQSFPILKDPTFRSSLLVWIDKKLECNPDFFEGLLLMFILYPHNRHFNFESCKLDLRKTMFLRNLIQLIKIAEPNMPPKEDPYNFEQDYSSWLHILYYLLGSNYIITECYKDGAEAFDMSLQCCPGYFEAKLPLGHCLMSLKLNKLQKEYVSTPTEKLLEMFAIPENQRVIKGDYLSWTQEELRQKAKQLFMEYIQEAPECDKKYQDGHYHLALLYKLEGNLQEAVKWKERGEDSEVKRLPFMEPLNLDSKKWLAGLDMLPTPKKEKRCSNRKCPKKRKDKVTLKPCPCHEVSYCGSECQAADWKEHKKICSTKMKKTK